MVPRWESPFARTVVLIRRNSLIHSCTVSENAVRKSQISELTASLKALATEPTDQLALFPDSAIKADDLVARFDDSVRAVYEDYESELSRSQLDALRVLSGRIAAISRDGSEFDAELWTDQALRTSAHWREVRQLASAALNTFDGDE